MKNKINITLKQAQQFNRMLSQLRKISMTYCTPDQLRKGSNRMRPSYEEELEMAYENIQIEAKFGAKGIKLLAIPSPPQPLK